MEEIFKDISWYEWKYQASNLGRIKSLLRKNSLWKTVNERILNIFLDNKWYLYTQLCKEWIKTKHKIHKLVIESFVWKRPEWMQINHIDWNKQNNSIENLEFCTWSENNLHKFRVLWYKSKWWSKLLWYKNPKSKKINQYNLDWNLIKEWWSIVDASRILWYCESSIICVLKWRQKTTWWYIWKYKKEVE